ncbi:glyoxylate/hydroxypyruvate reductase B-like [Ambystoma mexicanum]|uniref:glyoxylate/hydroxypyruvate reductase B-like n=1 Tax=Ambystoma mexicanum TaxID=8296 RepID=UPI0037E7C6D8
MEELPFMLVKEIGGPSGVVAEHEEFLKKHFRLITLKEFMEDKTHFSERITCIFGWGVKLKIDQELLQSLPNLKVIGVAGAGVDHLDLKMISTFGVKVTNTPQEVTSATADLAMTLLLASARDLLAGIQVAVSPDTETYPLNWMSDEVTGSTVGIIGMGGVGYKIAERARAFEMKILYHNRHRRKEEEERAVGATYCEKVEDLLEQSDYVILAVTLTSETANMIGKRAFELMRPTATLINISRGAVVDHNALVEALQNGSIKAAALDVTFPEPLPRNHPLLKMKNVILTPHSGTATHHCRRRMMMKVVDNILAVIHGQPIPNEVFQK